MKRGISTISTFDVTRYSERLRPSIQHMVEDEDKGRSSQVM